MRTIAEIYDEIVAHKDSQSFSSALLPAADNEAQLLDDLQSGSKVAIWRLWAYIVAAAIYTHEVLFELFKTEVSDAAAAANAGTARWYRDRILEFQNGDTLVYDPSIGKYKYATVDSGARIVKQCAVVEGNNGVVLFKAAKLVSGALAGLSSGEKDSLESYLKKIRFAGTRFSLISGDGDLIRIQAEVYFDGTRTLGTVQAEVEAAIKGYVEGLPFNGEFLVSKLVDTIQAVTGVEDVVIEHVKTKRTALDSYVWIDRIHIPVFGYYKFDATAGNALADTIQYISQ